MSGGRKIEDKKPIIGTGLILGSSILWGTALLYSQYILDNGMESKDLVSLKMLFGFLTMFAYILIRDRSLLKLDKRGILYSAIIGFICHALYNLFMFRSIEHTNISTTVTLLYTSPIFVMIISRIFLKEKINTNKILALVACVTGVFLTITAGNIGSLEFNTVGILYGLASGLCFGIMTVMNKFVVNDYNGITILTYTLGFAFIFSLIFSDPFAVLSIPFNPLVYLFILMLGILSTAVSYISYITGLSLGVESSKASIMATLEVPVSILGAVVIFSEKLVFAESIGILLVLFSVFLINERFSLRKSIAKMFKALN